MKKFQDFVRYLESFGEKSNIIENIVKICFERYPSEIKDFFQKIALKDPEVKTLMTKFEGEKDKDEDIAKPIADDGNTM